jgi:hypothetical protein
MEHRAPVPDSSTERVESDCVAFRRDVEGCLALEGPHLDRWVDLSHFGQLFFVKSDRVVLVLAAELGRPIAPTRVVGDG